MTMKIPFFDYPGQFTDHRDEYMRIFEDICSRGQFILGEEVERFEANLAAFTGAKHAIGVGNCTDGLLLALRAAGIGPGDEVISVSHTFVATIEVIIALGAKPVFVDIADDHNMDVEKVEAAITPETKAIVPVQLNGRVCTKMDRLVTIAEEHDLIIIEDSAQALGARYKDKCAGTFGLAGCFSFYPAKLLGTFGDAGAIITNDDNLASKLRMMRDHGRGEHGEVKLWGLNSRMDNLHAAILGSKLQRLDNAIERRREIAQRYYDGLKHMTQLRLPPPQSEDSPHFDVFQNYEIEAINCDGLMKYLLENWIRTSRPWGGKAIHQFAALGLSEFNLPRTESFFEKGLMLPMHPALDNDQVEYVINEVNRFYS